MRKDELEYLQQVVDGLTALIEKDISEIKKYSSRIKYTKLELKVLNEHLNVELNENA